MVNAQDTGMDVTSLLINPDFEVGDNSGWSYAVDGLSCGHANTAELYGYHGTHFMEAWCGSASVLGDFDWSQTVEVPNGYYVVTALAHAVRQDQEVTPDPHGVYVYAEDKQVEVTTTVASEYVLLVEVTDGALTIGYRGVDCDVNWVACDYFQVTQCSGSTEDELNTSWIKCEMTKLAGTLNKIIKNPMSAALRRDINASVAEIEDVVTLAAANTLWKTLKQQTSDAEKCVEAYGNLLLKIDEVYELVNGGADMLLDAADDAWTKYEEESMSMADALVEIDVLNQCVFNYEMSIADGKKEFDVTEMYLTNPSLRKNGDKTGWEFVCEHNKGWTASPAWGSDLLEFWNCDFSVTQTLTGIPNGKYKLRVQAFYRAGNMTAELFANNDAQKLMPLSKYTIADFGNLSGGFTGEGLANDLTSASSVFNAYNPVTGRNYYDENELEVIVMDGVLSFGIRNTTTEVGAWCAMRDFKLFYYGNFPGLNLYDKMEKVSDVISERFDDIPSAMRQEMESFLNANEKYTESGYSEEEVNAVLLELEAKWNKVLKSIDLFAALKAQVADVENNLLPCNYPGKGELQELVDIANYYFENDCKENTYETLLDFKAILDEGIIAYYYSQEATPEHPADYTHLISNPNFEEKGDWTWDVTANGRDLWIGGCRPSEEGGSNRQGVNLWGWGITAIDVHQVLTGLRNGLYKVSAELITQSGFATDQHVYAVGSSVVTSETLAVGGWDTNDWTTLTTKDYAIVVDGTLIIGAAASQGGDDAEGWFQATNFKLYYCGEVSSAFTDGKNVSAMLRNADMEQGLKYWNFDGIQLMGRNSKNVANQVGFHGMNQGVQEAWHSDPENPIGNLCAMQRISNLPNGTYVFGAYAAATRQTRNQATSNRDSIVGVSLFANGSEVAVTTDNPDLANRGYQWAHSSKFNVATQVTDGVIEVGLRVDGTNANYVVWDNVTFYYFGYMGAEEALDAMAEIDMTNAAAIADTLVGYKMNVDTLANLNAAIASAKAKISTASTLWDDSEGLFYNAGLARKSITDYVNLKRDIETAKLLTDETIEWSQKRTPGLVELLEEVIATSEEAYEVAELNRAGLKALRKELNWAAGDVHVDSVYRAWNELTAYITEVQDKVNQPGGITQVQLGNLETLKGEIRDTILKYEAEFELPIEVKTVNPKTLLPYISKVSEAIRHAEENPVSTEYTKMPIQFNTATNGWIEGAEWYDESKKIVGYTSPLYRFQGKIENFRITVKKNKNNAAFFCLSKLELFDGDGHRIELAEDNISSNADHNALNPYSPDGDGLAALFDEDNNSFFHSAWQNMPAEAHYLEVTLPNGGYDAFSFRMLSRSNSNGWDQSHTFPGEMVISTPTPKRDALETLVNEAKNLNAYSVPEPGFYVNDFSFLTDKIAEVEAALKTWASEDECEQLRKDLQGQIQKFNNTVDKSIHLPKAGAEYRIVSAFPGFYEKQFVEKALTVHAADTTLWWENVCADSLQQVFMFEPILDENGEPSSELETIENYDGTTLEKVYYHYTIKNVAYDLYVDNEFKNNQLHLIEQALDTVKLVCLGRGQWNIIVNSGTLNNSSYSSSGGVLHAGDHNSGNVSSSIGGYGGIYGISSGIVSWAGGIDSQSAWFIREYPELPLTVLVKNGVYKSDFIHFQADNTITLTADKACAFADLALYDLYGNAIEVADVTVLGNTATISMENNIVGCAFAFTNNEGVASVVFDAKESLLGLLQETLDEAVAIAPIEGLDVMQYTDLSEYNAAIAKAKVMLSAGATEEEVSAMIEELRTAVDNLTPNLPDPNRTYFIVNALEGFVDYHGVNMMMYADEDDVLRWNYENISNKNRYWQFEPAADGYYLKNVATGKYLGYASSMSASLSMVSTTDETRAYKITALSGDTVAISEASNTAYRLHAAGHASGRNGSGSIVYWNAGLGTASVWRICETGTYLCNPSMFLYGIDALTRETVNVPIEMENPEGTTSFQFDLYLPDGVTVANASLSGDRTIDHVVAVSQRPDGTWCVKGYSTTGSAFMGNEGVILNLSVNVPIGTIEGLHSVFLRNICMTLNNGTEYLVADFETTMKVTRKPLIGDVNDDDRYTISDVVMTVNEILGIAQENFNAAMADVNGDGYITIGDVVSILRMVLNGELPEGETLSTARRVVSRVVGNPTLNTNECVQTANNRMVMPIGLNNTCEYTAFQMDVVLPEGVELVKATLSDRAKNSHAIAWNKLSDGSTRVVAYALNNATFKGCEGTLLNLELDVTSGSEGEVLTLTNGFFTTPSGVEDSAAELSVPMRIGTTGMEPAEASAIRVYGVDGAVVVEGNINTVLKVYAITGKFIKQVQVMEGENVIALPAGMYVINGSKVIVK